jgi:hypothetical protein
MFGNDIQSYDDVGYGVIFEEDYLAIRWNSLNGMKEWNLTP